MNLHTDTKRHTTRTGIRFARRPLWAWTATGLLAWVSTVHGGCSCEDTGDPIPPGGGFAAAGATAGSGGAAGAGGLGFAGNGGSSATCGGTPCPPPFICRYDECIPDLGSCEDHDDCPGDSYCDSNGECIPYGVPPDVVNDPECQREDPPDGVDPVVQCEWTGPPAGDPTEGSTAIYTAPIVADLNLDDDPNRLQPSIIVTTFGTGAVRVGMLRIFDGRSCEEILHFGGPDDPNANDNRPGYGTQWAVADLDGDVPTGGYPEIIGLQNPDATTNAHALRVYALELDTTTSPPTASRRWYGRQCDAGNTLVEMQSNTANYGPGVWDLDDDGSPEVVVDQNVFDANGCLLNALTDQPYLGHGVMSTVADVDLDGSPELVRYDRVARWDTTSTEWVDESWFVPDAVDHKPGHVAVVDLGAYSAIPGSPLPNQLPEVVVVSAETTTYAPQSTGTIRVQTLDGTIVWGPIELQHDVGIYGGHGGPPTASDFDGDGYVEFAAAANQYYTVYDPDCGGGSVDPATARPGGLCDRSGVIGGDTLPDGVLWARLSQDFSSSETGSSIFDFNGDGAAEAVYGDECFVRVYEGATGNVIFSAPASSGTGFELPVIADVDGDFATEIVVARTEVAAGFCPAVDPLLPTVSSENRGGFAVLRDPEDRWAASRPIWNQHAYSITHVRDDATIPASSQVAPNWTSTGLNNFRQNTQGDLGMLNIADLTVVMTDVGELCAGEPGTTTLHARVCNRGTNPVQDGVSVQFIESNETSTGGGTPDGTLVCETATTMLLEPGECESLECTGELTGQINIFVIVDPDGTIADCHPGNNDGAGLLQLCPS